MSEKIKILAYGLWIAHPVVQTAIALVMLRRGQYRQFKYFFTYIVAQILIFAMVFPAYLHGYSGYFNLFWATNGISVVLGFQAMTAFARAPPAEVPTLMMLASAAFAS